MKKIGILCICIVVVLATVMVLPAFGNSVGGGGGATIDPKVVGQWNRNVVSGNGTMRYWYWWLNTDGTFSYFLMTSAEYSYKGKYSTSEGKIYFTNVVFTNDDHKNNEPDSYVDYVILHDEWGDQLRIDNTGSSFTGSTWWRRES